MPTPIIFSSSSSAVGVSRVTLRQRLARTLGYFATGTVNTVAASLEAESYILSNAMRSDGAPPEHFDGLFAYVTSGVYIGEQRRLLNGAFDGPIGALKVDYPYTAALASGVSFELSVLPAEPYLGMGGLNQIINEALETLPVIDIGQLTVTATAGVTDTQYDMSSYSWPVKSVRAVYYPRTLSGSQPRQAMPKVWDFVNDAEQPMLSFRQLPANVGDVIEVELTRPANTRIRQSSVWGDSLVGMTADSDQQLYDVQSVINAARPIALERLAHLWPMGSKERAEYLGMADRERRVAQFSKFFGQFRGSGAQKVGHR